MYLLSPADSPHCHHALVVHLSQLVNQYFPNSDNSVPSQVVHGKNVFVIKQNFGFGPDNPFILYDQSPV